MSWWSWTESSSWIKNPAIETSHCLYKGITYSFTSHVPFTEKKSANTFILYVWFCTWINVHALTVGRSKWGRFWFQIGHDQHVFYFPLLNKYTLSKSFWCESSEPRVFFVALDPYSGPRICFMENLQIENLNFDFWYDQLCIHGNVKEIIILFN